MSKIEDCCRSVRMMPERNAHQKAHGGWGRMMLVGVEGTPTVIAGTACVRRMMTIDAVRYSSAHKEVILRPRRLTFDDARRCLMAHG